MNDTHKLIIGIIVGSLAQILTFFQLQGQLKYEWIKNHYWATVFLGIPISILFMYSVKNLVMAFGGEMWPSRLIGFSIGTIVFSVLSLTIFQEPISMKTSVCLALAISILVVQLCWK